MDTGLVHRVVCLFIPQLSMAFTTPIHGRVGTGQAELTWVAGYIPRWFICLQTVTDPSINRARRTVTSLMLPTMLPLSQTANLSNLIISDGVKDTDVKAKANELPIKDKAQGQIHVP